MAFGMMGRIFTDFGAGMTRNFPLGMQDGVVAIIAVLLMLLVDILCENSRICARSWRFRRCMCAGRC